MQSHIDSICLTFLHCVFSNVGSNCLPEKRHSHIGYICLTFLHCVFSNVPTNGLLEKMHSHIGCICLFFLQGHRPWQISGMSTEQSCDQTNGKYFILKDVKFLKKTTGIVVKSNKCNQCDYASSHAGHLKTRLKTHSGEKSNKCNQCGRLCLYSGRHFEDTSENT